MKRVALTASAVLLAVCAASRGQASKGAAGFSDKQEFELTPVAPPTPALKYQLMFDDFADRLPGNGAMLYLDAILLMKPDTQDKVGKAIDAYSAKDYETFDALARELDQPSVVEELTLAGRRTRCDWEPPFREAGIRTLLPHLGRLRDVLMLLKVRALHQVRQGKMDEALATFRLGYVMSDRVSREPVLVSALVAGGMVAALDEALPQLINAPGSPNLYWALNDVPRRLPTFGSTFEGGRLGSATVTFPALARVLAGQELTADEWRGVMKEVAAITAAEPQAKSAPDPVRGASPEVLRAARAFYATTRRISAEQAEKVDPAAVLGAYYFNQYVVAYDDMYKLRNLPYRTLLPMAADFVKQVEQWRKEQPANPFLKGLPALDRAITTFARVDRGLAALTAVEAIRAYAAGHGGALPQRLEDVTATPVPENPFTGKPFEYRVDGNVATLSDTQSESHLTYTVRARK